MKTSNKLKNFIPILALVILCTNNLNAQSIIMIPGQNFGENYTGNPIIYNHGQYVSYKKDKSYLAKANGSAISIIQNPDGGSGYAGYPIVFNNKLYIGYQSSTVAQLAVYDGNNIQLIANPPNTLGYFGFPVVYNNKLYLEYKITSTTFQLYEFDGTTFKAIDNINGTTLNEFDYGPTGYKFYPIVYNSKLYLPYIQTGGNRLYKLGEFDGSNLTILDLLSNNSYIGSPVIYNSKLCFGYTGGSGLAEYDGVNPFKSIPLEKTANNFQGVAPNLEPIVFSNKLYLHCVITGSNSLGQYGGDSLRLIPNPDDGLGYAGNPVINNNQLYFGYANALHQTILGTYNDTNISLIPNPPNPHFYDNQLTSYHNELYLRYTGNPSTYKYDGNILVSVTDAAGLGFSGSSIIYNDSLFFADQYFISGNNHLAYLGDVILPIQLLNFSVSLQKSNCLITWQTATEINTNYFNIQRSRDGVNFSNINKIPAAINSSSLKNYSYTDIGVTELNINKLYYRLQEVDKDGKNNYSTIKTIDLSSRRSLFSISPNPSKDFVNIISAYNVSDAQISITDMNGKTLFTSKQNFVTGQQLKISLSKFPVEVLIVTIKSNNNIEQFKVVKL